MSKKISSLVWYSTFLLYLLIYFARNNPEIIEKYYSRIFYPLVLDLHQFFLDFIHFSLGDILYLFLFFLIIKTIFKKISYWKVKPMNMFLDFGSLVILLAWIFHLSWGLNYHRLPLNEQFEISIKYSKQDLEDRLDKIIEKSNQWHDKLVSNDTFAVTFPFSRENISEKTSLIYNPVYHKTVLNTYKVKKSLVSLPLSYMGYSGYLNPFTLESQLNVKIPIQSLITTLLHETAHQMGYAAENEANFIAYLSAISSEDPHIQYAGNIFAFRYLFNNFYKLNPEEARNKLKHLNPGILKNLKEVRDFWKKYKNPFEVIFDKTYDSYLKANGQKSGIKSYNEMVGLVINYHKNVK